MERIETPIMLLFFNRPDVLSQVFERIREIKPKQLFLVQDGARIDRADDIENIKKCREIVENIDWECDVKKNYAENNMSCDEREFSGIDWCFQFVDRLIILEDDCVPTHSFYRFCGELLEKYKDDERIHMISGFNRINEYKDSPYDYVFSYTGAGWGWATWKRVWKQVKSIKGWKFIEDEALIRYYEPFLIKNYGKSYEGILNRARKAKAEDEEKGIVSTWENYLGMAMCFNNSLVITPTKNMISYVGVSENATHCVSDAKLLPKNTRILLTQNSYEVEFPLKHPPFVVRDTLFEKKDYQAFFSQSRILNHFEVLFLKIRYAKWELIMNSIRKKWTKKDKIK